MNSSPEGLDGWCEWVAEAVLWTAWRHQGDLKVSGGEVAELLRMEQGLFFEVMRSHSQTWLYAAVYGEQLSSISTATY